MAGLFFTFYITKHTHTNKGGSIFRMENLAIFRCSKSINPYSMRTKQWLLIGDKKKRGTSYSKMML